MGAAQLIITPPVAYVSHSPALPAVADLPTGSDTSLVGQKALFPRL